MRREEDTVWSVFEIKPLSQWHCESPEDIQQLKDYLRSLCEDGRSVMPGKWSTFFPNDKIGTINIPTGVTVGGGKVDGSYMYGSPDNNGMIYYATGDAAYPIR